MKDGPTVGAREEEIQTDTRVAGENRGLGEAEGEPQEPELFVAVGSLGAEQ